MRISLPCIVLTGSLFLSVQSLSAQERTDTIAQDPSGIQTTTASIPGTSIKDSADTKKKPRHSHFEAELSYVNDNVYLGRKDSVAIPYMSPRIGFFHKGGFFADLALGYMTGSGETRIDMTALDAGYAFEAGNYEGSLTATKYWYNNNSTNVRAEMKGTIGYSNAYDFGFIKPTMELSLNIGNKSDFAGAFGLSHSFYVLNDNLEFTPTFTANASTQNYYSDYYKKRRYSKARKGKTPVTGTALVSGVVQNAAAFKFLDYEFSLPLSYEAGRFTFSVVPVYAIPVNPEQILITTQLTNVTISSKMHTEKIEGSFFCTFGILCKF
ncbi:hypothetical protein ACX0G9_22090 [Flavitalea flava]